MQIPVYKHNQLHYQFSWRFELSLLEVNYYIPYCSCHHILLHQESQDETVPAVVAHITHV